MHHRRSIRLPDYDYAANGAYFITICTHIKAYLFGDIVDGVMNMNAWGQIVEEEWQKTGLQRPYIELDAFVVMPNHFHAILIIDHASNDATRRGMMHHAPAKTLPSQTNHEATSQARQFSKPLPESLGSIVGTFKAAVTRNINRLRTDISPIWQRNYYEHIIRDNERYEFIRAYIETNLQRWAEDSLYKST